MEEHVLCPNGLTRPQEVKDYLSRLTSVERKELAQVKRLRIDIGGETQDGMMALNDLYRALPSLTPKMEWLTVVWIDRNGSNATDGSMVGDVKSLCESMPALQTMEIATTSESDEREAFRRLFPDRVKVLVWETYDRLDPTADYDPEKETFGTKALNGWWENGRRDPTH